MSSVLVLVYLSFIMMSANGSLFDHRLTESSWSSVNGNVKCCNREEIRPGTPVHAVMRWKNNSTSEKAIEKRQL